MKYILSTLLFAIVTNLFATEYYVAKNGSDVNIGSIESPFLTISKAASIVDAGDICYIREGKYRETVNPLNNGQEGSPIKFMAYPSEIVTITGLDIISNWIPDTNEIWKTNSDKSTSQLFINGRCADIAQFPNAGPQRLDNSLWANTNLAGNKTGSMEGISAFSDLKGATIVALGNRKWVTVMGTIISHSGNDFSVNNESAQWSTYNPDVYLGNGKGFVYNHKELLDADFEWYYNNNELFIIPPNKKQPADLLVEGRVRENGFNLNDKKYIEVRNIHFKAANITMRNAENCIVENCIIRYPKAIFEFKNGFNRDTREPEKWDGNGFEVSGKNNLIKSCYIAHSWGDGITLWGENNSVINCIVEDCDWLAVDSAPLCVTGNGHTIENNTIRTTGRSVLVHRYLEEAKIRYNDLYNCGLLTDDLGLTYSFQTDGKGTEISYNYVHDNKAIHTGPGIYLDNGDKNYLVHHNVVWNCGAGIRLNLPQDSTDVFNNTFWNNRNPMGVWGPDGTEMKACRTWNNIQDHEQFFGNSMLNNLYTKDDQFENVEMNDFRLSSTATAIDFGIEIPGITDGFAGEAPDAGAYEAGDNWTAGAQLEIPELPEIAPLAPDYLTAWAEIGKIHLSWRDLSKNESAYAIDRKIEGETFQEIALLDSNSSVFVDTTVEIYTVYIYRIRAHNYYGSSLPLNTVRIKALGDGTSILLEAENYDAQSGINHEGNQIGGCDNNDFVMFESIDFGAGFNHFITNCAVPDEFSGKTLDIRINSLEGTKIGSLKVESTGGWGNFQEQACFIDTIMGIHDLYIAFKGGSGVGNFDWFKFSNKVQSSLLNNDLLKHINIYPNPVSDNLTIKLHKPNALLIKASIFNLKGENIYENEYSLNYSITSEININTTFLNNGLYILQLSGDNKKFETRFLKIN